MIRDIMLVLVAVGTAALSPISRDHYAHWDNIRGRWYEVGAPCEDNSTKRHQSEYSRRQETRGGFCLASFLSAGVRVSVAGRMPASRGADVK